MVKCRLRLWIIILAFILISSILHLPSKGISILARYFLKYKYGLSAEWTSFKGGLVNGIIMEGARVSNKDYTFLQCPHIVSNIRFRDFISPQNNFPYYTSFEKPTLSIKIPSSFQTYIAAIPLGVKVQILVSGAELLLQDSDRLILLKLDNLSGNINKNGEFLSIFLATPDRLTSLTGEISLDNSKATLKIVNGKIEFSSGDLPPIVINGCITLDTQGVRIEKGVVSLGELELEVGGSIYADRRLNLEINPMLHRDEVNYRDGEPMFLVRGLLDKPQIFTNWGVLETMLQIEGAYYSNERLIFPRVVGEIQLPGFMPFELEGELVLGMGDISFKDTTLARVVNIDGIISRQKESRLRLWVENAKGEALANQLPEVLRPLISSHTIDVRVSVYGGIDNLQAGGILNLFSYPIKIACRYRHNRFSFRSIGQGPFRITGSINLGEEPSIKIKGYFHKMDFMDLMATFTEDIDSNWKGTIDGEFRVSGELNDPLIQAKLEIEEGQIGDMKFDVAYINLEKIGSILDLQHSIVYCKEIPAELTGYIDLKGEDLLANINIIPASDSFIWKGLNVIKDVKEETVIFGQDVNENISVQFKSPLTSDPERSGVDSEPEVEVEYKLLKDKSILIKMEEDEGTIGIEHKVKF